MYESEEFRYESETSAGKNPKNDGRTMWRIVWKLF